MSDSVAAIVLNYCNWHETVRCVRDLRANSEAPIRIFVVDNASPDDSIVALSEELGEIQGVDIHASPVNGGFAAGNNAGCRLAIRNGADYLVVLNPDVRVSTGAVDRLIGKLREFPEVAVVGPSVKDPNGETLHYARGELSFGKYLSIRRPFSYVLSRMRKEYLNVSLDSSEDFTFSGMVSGCCFAFRASDYLEFDGFDEATFLFYEEDILGLKLKRLGRKACVCASAEVLHQGSTSVAACGAAFVDFHRYRSAYYALRAYVGVTPLQASVVKALNLAVFAFRGLRDPHYSRLLVRLLQAQREIDSTVTRQDAYV